MAKLLQYLVLLFFLLCCMDSLTSGSTIKSGFSSGGKETGDMTKAASNGLSSCVSCHDRQKTSINNENSTQPSRFLMDNDATFNKIIPEESEKVIFSRKYSPEIRSQSDGFVPVPGPYGMKSRLARAHVLKPTAASSYWVGSAPRNMNSALNHAHDKNHALRNVQSVKAHQSVQRRAQYRNPKAVEDLTVKESVANENILGNGNFEIIRGGIFSDQDANEILGSRRMGRGFSSFVAPTYQQSRFHPIRNVQFPPVYQGHIQNQFNPLFYPRGPY